MDLAALIVAIASGIIALGSAGYTRMAARANRRSADADEITAALEGDRRHAELTPRLRVRCAPANAGSEDFKLTVELLGPPELGGLDSLEVTIRNDNPWRGQGTPLAGGPSPEAVAAHLWSPLRFKSGTGPGADPVNGVPGADPTGRTTPTSGFPVGEALPFFLEPTTPPVWSEGQSSQDWRRERGTVLRLSFLCGKDGTEWTLVGEIDTQTDNAVIIPERH
ncbi:Uncharacterised protein [Amycolatopsis camponoti]|uniref:Uncharacterized protein n=1 Tax=Amycolatopsis camponoti TaxID=2606593 RepID=A0A6I8LYN0_9PSEU|nr:hypothetical protein [Amycolatopsis camponoti]VVJ21643.1 Uncharacterised protein [Amycolatopsis camponoti]